MLVNYFRTNQRKMIKVKYDKINKVGSKAATLYFEMI